MAITILNIRLTRPRIDQLLLLKSLRRCRLRKTGSGGNIMPTEANEPTSVGSSALFLQCPKAVIGRRRRMEIPNGRSDSHPLRLGCRDVARLCARQTSAMGTDEEGLPYKL